MSLNEAIPFGVLLKQLRKRAGMTQRDLAAALNYSGAQISNLEKGQRLPDLETVVTRFVPALGLQDDPVTAAHLIECAASTRGERSPEIVQTLDNLRRSRRSEYREEIDEQPYQLPSSPTELIGRTEEVNQVCNRLLGHSGRLLTLVGPPGIGKTRLALAVADCLQHSYVDGVVFVALAEITDATLMASTIVATLGWNDASPKPPQTKLIERLRHKTMLLVLDNCEQIRDAAPLVAEVLAACAGIVVLATSRERLHLRAEQRFRVPPLQLAASVELFTQRAAAVDAGFALTEANRPMVEAICERLDRLPLALELCAAQTDLLSLPQLLGHLHKRRLDLLVDGAHDLPPRQRTLRHAIQRSYALLSEDERKLFRSLGVFVGGFALPEFEALSMWGQETVKQEGVLTKRRSTLHALISKSLVRAETLPSGEQRFLLLEMIREFAVEQLQAHEEEHLLCERHYATYLHFARTADSHLRGAEATTWLARLEAEHDNIRAALQWTLDEARYIDAVWLVLAVRYFWIVGGYGYEGAKWIAQLLPQRQTLTTDLRLAILLSFYSVAFALEEFQPVDRYIDEVMQLLEVGAHKLLHARALTYLPETTANISRVTALEQSVALARAASESPELGAEFGAFGDRDDTLRTALWVYAHSLTEQGEVTRALPIATESYIICQARGHQIGIACALSTLGLLALLQEDLAQARSRLSEAITRAMDSQKLLCELQPLLGLVTLYTGNATEARRLLEESLRHCLELRNRIYLKWVCTYLAELALWEGELEQAEHWLAQSMAYHAELLRITIYEVRRLFLFARLATAQQHYQRAATLFGLAEQAHSQIHFVLYTWPLRIQIDTALATVREALGAEFFDEAFTTGQRLSLDKAYRTLLMPAHITLPIPT